MHHIHAMASLGHGFMPLGSGPVAQAVHFPKLNNRYDELGPHAPGFRFAAPEELARKLQALFPYTAAIAPTSMDPVTSACVQQQQLHLARSRQRLLQAMLWQAWQMPVRLHTVQRPGF
jgi:hypothetical protein